MIFVFLFLKANRIKKVKKILLILIVGVVSMPTILFLALNSGWVQNKLTQHVTAILSENMGNRISVGDIRVTWFNRVNINDLLVTDVHGDTILSTPELIARLNFLAFSSRNIELRKVILNRADIRFAIDPEIDAINIKFIIERLKSKDTTENKPKWMFGIRSIELNDCHFTFKNITKPFDRPFGMDYADLDVSNLNMALSGFHPGDSLGGVEFRIRRLSCVEKCGLDVKFMSADFAVNRHNMLFKNTHIVTSISEIEAKNVYFHFDSFQDFSDGKFTSLVTMNVDIRSSEVAFEDLSNFVPYFDKYSGKAMVTGKITGTVENLKGEKIDVRFGDMTRIYGNYDMKGLPNIRTTLIYADVVELLTCPQDIERIHLQRSPTGYVNLPVAMQRITNIGFKGKFTGFFDDFVTFGTFTTNLGNLSTDLAIKPKAGLETDTAFTFLGALKTEHFHLGRLLTLPAIGEVTLSGMVEGVASGKGNINAQLEGLISSIYLRGYDYRNIVINGAINNRTYDGQLSIDEPNIKMDFSGKVDLTKTIPAFDFWANVERAKLHELKLMEKDTSSFAAFNIRAEFSGTNIDNLSGELNLKNSFFRRNSREIEINDLVIFTKEISDTNRFVLRSDILDAQIKGQYQFLKLPESFLSLIKNFAPAWAPAHANPDSLSQNNFRFEVRFKETQRLSNFFVNEFHIARGARIEGVYNPSQLDFHFLLHAPSMTLAGKKWLGFYMNGSVEDSTYVVESGCAAFQVSKNMKFEHLTVLARARGDSVGMDIRWNNWDSVSNRGSLSSKIFFEKKSKKIVPKINIYSLPGRIVTSGDEWKLSHQGIFIDSTAIKINSIRAIQDSQELLISGIVSQREQDKLEITVKDLDLTVLKSSLKFDKLLFGGIVNGSATLSNLYGVPVFLSDLHVDDFSVNNQPFGSTELAASWNSVNRSVRIEAESLLNDLHTMDVKGNYFINDHTLDFDISLEKIPVNVLCPYICNIFTDLEGTISSKLKLTGMLNNPLMNGSIEIQKAALTLDYTKTRYNFSGVTAVTDNKILFRNIEMFDRLRNSCKITDGYLYFEKFKNIAFDLQFQANHLEVLNTEERDNSMFFGNVFATGKVGIKGIPRDVEMDIAVRTEKNTDFRIPLSSGDEVSKTSFIKFVDHTPRTQRRSREFYRRTTVNTSGELLPETKFAITMNLDVTPDAEARLIFDAKIGDEIRSRGNGNMILNIANNQFNMTGTYIIDEGTYLFTLRNFLTGKHFAIKKGGYINWNGDPAKALLNIEAAYTARPSLSDLMNNDNFKRSVPVECILHITDLLTDPKVRFDLEIPNAEQEVRAFLSAATHTEEERNRQFIFLLAFNRFYPDPSQTANSGSSGTGLETMGLSAASEFLTSQLSHMISQWGDFDVDITARPGAYGFDVNTNRVNLHYIYNYEGAVENTDYNFGGEFSFEYKPKKSDKFRFKAFNRANAVYFSQNPYTWGIGVLFREEFNHLRDLFSRKKAPAIRREDDDENPDLAGLKNDHF